jgi:hypothetical protein
MSVLEILAAARGQPASSGETQPASEGARTDAPNGSAHADERELEDDTRSMPTDVSSILAYCRRLDGD